MKTNKRRIIFILLLIAFALLLTGCNKKASQEYCDKIIESIDNNNPMTYSQIIKDLGKTDTDTLANYNIETGYVIWFRGYKSSKDATEAVKKGKEVYYLFVYFEDNLATKAEYKLYTLYDAVSFK